MFWVPLIMAAIAAGKSASDAAGRERDQKVQAETTRNSPWTGMKGADPRQADTFGTMIKGVQSGLIAGKALDGYDFSTPGAASGATTGASPWAGMMNRNFPEREY